MTNPLNNYSFHCLFCFGYEDRGAKSTGVLVVPPLSSILLLHMVTAANAAQLSDELAIYRNGDESVTTQLAPITKAPFKIDARKIVRLVDNSEPAVTVEFADGSTKEEKFLVHHPQTKIQGPFAEQLGIAITPTGEISADPPTYSGVQKVCGTPPPWLP